MISFEKDGHVYTTADGTRIPSVTQILLAEGFIDPTYFTEEACARGIAVHTACQMIDEFKDPPPLPEDWDRYVEAYQNFLKDSVIETVATEKRVYSDAWGYAGTVDLLGYINGREAVIDRKTGQPAPWHGLQTAAYDEAEPITPRRHRYGLYLRNNGTYSLKQHKDRSDYQTFLAAVTVHKWKARTA
jgi:hypothetical protein